MKTSFRLLLSVLAVGGSLAVANIAYAQTTSSGGTAAKKSLKETSAARRNAGEEKSRQQQERVKERDKKDIAVMEARKRKKADCSKQAKAKKLHLLKRRSFMKKCMAG
jgi:hypothetical protein